MRFLTSSIRTKIIFPYILLTLIVGMAGAYVATRLVFSTTLERLDNQLLGAGRVASKTILDQELERLVTLRNVSQTAGIVESLIEQDYTRLQALVLSIAENDTQVDSIVVLNGDGVEVFKLNRTETETFFPPEINAGTSYAEWASVINQVLLDQPSELGDKYTVLAQDQGGNRDLIYSVGPMRLDGQVVGVVLIGNYLEHVLEEIRLYSLADITFYTPGGEARYTTFSESQAEVRNILKITPELYQRIIANTDTTEKEWLTLLGQQYSIAFAPLQLRGETLGVYSVGLVADSVIASGNISRNIFSLIIFFAITVLMIIAYIVTQQITRPLARLVKVSGAVAAGDLTRQTGIASHDEIGRLATTFDQMTVELRRRTEQLQDLVREREEEASKVRAILSSIADGVLVQDRGGQIIEMNRAAERTINQLIRFYPDPLKEIVGNVPTVEEEIRRFNLADQDFDARTAYVITHQNDILGSVAVLRDITTEVQATKQLQKIVKEREEETSRVRAILSSIADGVLVLDKNGNIVETNRAAKQILNDLSNGSALTIGPEALLTLFTDTDEDERVSNGNNFARLQRPKRFVIGNHILIAWASPVSTDDDQVLGTVIVLHDTPAQMDLLSISPFVTAGPTSNRVFFGRDQKVQLLLSRIADNSFAFLGGRRIGKSSLLNQLHRVHLPLAGYRTVYLDCANVLDYGNFLSMPIHNWRPEPPPDPPDTLGELFESPAEDQKLVLLFDEADKLVVIDQNSSWQIFNTLRAFVNSGQGQIILSGERTLRESLKDASSPLFNLVQEMVLDPLDRLSVDELITQPMEQLGIELIDRRQTVDRIYHFTGGHPNVVQRLCHRLIERLNEQGSRSITLQDVETIIRDPDFQRDDFLNTYWDAATLPEKLILLLMVENRNIRKVQDIQDSLRKRCHLDFKIHQIESFIQLLIDLRYLLKRSPEGYEFAVEAFPEVVTQIITVDDMIESLIEEYLEQAASVASYS